MLATSAGSLALLLDIDGVLHVGDEPIPGAIEALEDLRARCSGVRLVTSTTSQPRMGACGPWARAGRLDAVWMDPLVLRKRG